MFTGIVEEIGNVRTVGPEVLAMAARKVLEGTRLGDSIAVNGVCLTVTRLEPDGFTVGLSPETLRRTNLGDLHPGAVVNLERALAVGERMGGHYVQGHVDGVGTITRVEREGNSLNYTFEAPPEIMRYVVEKGFIALDGVSLTVTRRSEQDFSITLIPHSQENVIMTSKRRGDRVNIEVDILAKYVEQFLAARMPGSSGLTEQKLADAGF